MTGMNWSSCRALTTAGVDGGDLADLADVVLDVRVVLVDQLQLACADQPTVTAGQAHRLAAGGVDQADDVLLHLAGQHPLDDLHRLLVGDAHALHEGALLAQPGQRLVDLRAAAVNHDRVHADQLQQHHVLGEILLQRRVGHRVAAVLDDQRLAVELADVGQRLRQDLGLLARGDVGHVGEVGGGHGAGGGWGGRREIVGRPRAAAAELVLPATLLVRSRYPPLPMLRPSRRPHHRLALAGHRAAAGARLGDGGHADGAERRSA